MNLHEWVFPAKHPVNVDFKHPKYESWQQDLDLHYVGVPAQRTNSYDRVLVTRDSEFLYYNNVPILRYNPQGKASKYLANLGRSTTLDIYIYHRPIYALLLAITPPSEYWIYHKAGAIIVFVITLTLVMTVKPIKKTCNIK